MPFKKKTGSRVKWVGRVQKEGQIRQRVCDTKAEAKAWEAQEKASEWKVEQPEVKIVTVFVWMNEYLDFAKERFTAKTYEEKRTAFARLLKIVGAKDEAQSITVHQSLRCLKARAKVSGYAANKDRKNLIAAWGWGIRFLDLPERNPFKAVPRFGEERLAKYVPPEEDFWRVYEVAETEQDRVFLLTLLHTAARKGEIISLTWSDIDFGESRIRLWTRKRQGGNLESDWIPMTEALCQALIKHRSNAKGIHVFTREKGQPYKWRQHLMKYLCGIAGVKHFTFHAIRHLTASMLDKAGIELTVIQAILRHKSATTTARYLHALRGTKVALDAVFARTNVLPMKKAV
jgi:Site-specific recombinase XerD